MNNKVKILALSGALVAGSASAEIALNGFASIVAGQTTKSSESLYGYTNELDFKQDSLFALQASSDLGDGLSVTAQLLSRGEKDWKPEFEWAYVGYEATDNLKILAGRQRVPFYMYSDFLDVSYAYSWITPPSGVYNVIFSTFDGLAGLYNFQLGEFDNTLHLIYGRNNDSQYILGEDMDLDFKALYGGAFTVTRDWLTLRAAYFKSDITVPYSQFEQLSGAWSQAGFADVASHSRVKDDPADFVELGFQLDYDNFLVIGEYTKLTTTNTPLSDEESYYVMGGYRYSDFLFHLTYGQDKDSLANYISHVPSGVDPGLDQLIGATNGLIASQQEESKYYTAGMRWNFHDSASFKLEYTKYEDTLNNAGDAGLVRTAIVTVF